MEQFVCLLEKIIDSPALKVAVICYAAFALVLLALVVGVFVYVFKEMRDFDKRFKRW